LKQLGTDDRRIEALVVSRLKITNASDSPLPLKFPIAVDEAIKS